MRFIDNFSGGLRGARSAEQLVLAGYTVLFLHRTRSLLPFHRRLTTLADAPLDALALDSHGRATIRPEHSAALSSALSQLASATAADSLLLLSFTTLSEYLSHLRALTRALQPLARRALFYSAAAVSDFYLPPERLARDKLQSSAGALTLQLALVPKVVPELKRWAPDMCLATFKLETDAALLRPKMRGHLQRYGVDLVIGNLLYERDRRVVVGRLDWEGEVEEREIVRGDDSEEIEGALVEHVVALHRKHMEKK